MPDTNPHENRIVFAVTALVAIVLALALLLSFVQWQG